MMFVKEIKIKDEYNDFIVNQEYSQFLQSWEWGEFLKLEGKDILRLGFYGNSKLFFSITLIRKNLPFSLFYFYAPRIGLKSLLKEQIEFVFEEIERIAKKEKIIFLRFDPISNIIKNKFINRIKSTIDVQPKKTIIIDLTRSEEEILAQMHQKTRYNIRLAIKKGVVVKEINQNDFEEFWKLMEETKKRDAFRLHNKAHYEKMFLFGRKESLVKFYGAFYKNKMIAVNIISFFGNMATYVHGASANENRNVMAPYLLQWEVMKLAKKLGFDSYDLYGIDEDKWPGVTKFKRGFNGAEINYPGAFDLIFNKTVYNFYKMIRKIRRVFKF